MIEGDPLTMNLPVKLPMPPEKLIGDEEITGTRVLKLSEMRINGPTERWRTFRFTVDGKTFDPDRVDQRVRLGGVEEWTIINDQPDDPEDHVFHIHTNDMLLTKINGEPLEEPIWLDTAIVPREGSITFRSRFLDFTGKYMLHCHMMNHEELGMMQVVFGTAPSTPWRPPRATAWGSRQGSSSTSTNGPPRSITIRGPQWVRFEDTNRSLIS